MWKLIKDICPSYYLVGHGIRNSKTKEGDENGIVVADSRGEKRRIIRYTLDQWATGDDYKEFEFEVPATFGEITKGIKLPCLEIDVYN